MMCVRKDLYLCMLLLHVLEGARASSCGQRCSLVLAPVCALVTVGSARDVRHYHNTCHLHKIQCLLKETIDVAVKVLPGSFCGNRRYVDNTIIGSRGLCNHTCPTHCTDIYDPVCAEIWEPTKNKGNHILINHCHADLLSCALQQSLQVQTIDHCLGSQTQFAYSALAQAAVMKRLGLMNV